MKINEIGLLVVCLVSLNGFADKGVGTWEMVPSLGAAYGKGGVLVGKEIFSLDLYGGNRFDTETKKWGKAIPRVPNKYLRSPALVSNNRGVFMADGLGGTFQFDHLTSTWKELSKLGDQCAGITLVGAGDDLYAFGGCGPYLAQVYDFDMEGWRLLPDPPPFGLHPHAIWTGKVFVVWGGVKNFSYPTQFEWNGGVYDPETKTWEVMNMQGAPSVRDREIKIGQDYVVWAGDEMIVWGGKLQNVPLMNGAAYSVEKNRWRPISEVGAPGKLWDYSITVVNDQLLIWGGMPRDYVFSNAGALYDPKTDTWKSISLEGAPLARYAHIAVAFGNKVLISQGAGGNPNLDAAVLSLD